jgi:hypothetical protein
MQQTNLSPVQSANLNMLTLIAEYAKSNKADACSRFGIDLTQAEFLATLSNEQIKIRAIHLGDVSLFLPRHDLVQILSWPSPLAETLLMAHPARPIHLLGTNATPK